ncbi:unnamed protein product [Adineta ricciae]|uniref:Transcription initiation factor IIE subunit beta n=1 Tax=Adineta ricciae TaxID=249248 RepID=A0A814GM46_ADIRI|nr:unnamed protein product [Adineta ricciae]CAF1145526.1 unnamed protein product [Adineta ricciae]
MASSSSAALFKEREKFIKRQADEAAFLASAEKRQKTDKPSTQKANRSKSALPRPKTLSDFSSDFQSSSSGSKLRNLTLTKIVLKLQERYLSGQTESVTLEEIVEEAGVTIDSSDKHWLASDALLTNPKIYVEPVDDVNKFVYKPPLDLKAPKKTSLLNLLKSRHEKCEGAVTVDDVRETIPSNRADLFIESLIKSKDVVKVTNNKREILFYTDRAYDLQVNPEFIESWRRISVEGLDDKMIAEFLKNQGHRVLTKNAPRPMELAPKAKRGGRRPDTMKHNQHVAHQLEDYTQMANKK